MPYLPALDGIRAFAVLAVIIYHANASWLPAGFLGVDIFFVLSGYLITSLLLVEWRQRQALDLPAFWRRRARRLLPALYLVLLVSLTFCALFLRSELARQRLDALAAFGYGTNWYLIFRHQSYFESVGRPSLLQHLWSLAVEEQFYLCWPLIVMFGLRGSPRRLLGLIAAGIVGSLALAIALYHPGVDPSRIYYGTDSRAVELLAGAALACLWQPWRGEPAWMMPSLSRFRWLLEGVGLATFGVIVLTCCVIQYDDPRLYRGGFGLVALVTALLVAVCVHPAARVLPRLLSLAPLRWLGERSYGLYLWHWPIMMVTRPQLDVPLSGLPLFALQLAATLILTEMSYRLVEQPIRHGALGRAWAALRAGWRQDQTPQRVALWSGGAVAFGVGLLALGTVTVEAQAPAPPSYLAVQSIHSVAPVASPTSAASPVAALALVPSTATPAASELSPLTDTGAPGPQSGAVPTAEATAAPPPTLAPTPTPTPSPVPTTAPTATLTPTPLPTRVALPADGPRVSALGDSVMVGAADALNQTIPNIGIDAVEGRQMDDLIATARSLQSQGALGQIVVVQMGANGTVSADQFNTLMQLLGKRTVIVLNAKVPRWWQDPNDAVMASGVQHFPNAMLIDWRAASSSHPELFYEDGIHLRPAGADFYANLIAGVISGVETGSTSQH